MNGDIEYILDTNILIYLANKEDRYIQFIAKLDANIGISVVTYLEFLIGAESKYVDVFERVFEVLDFTPNIAKEVAKELKKRDRRNLRNPKFPDIVIAKTALFHEATLVTNNPKDFMWSKEIKIATP